MTEHILSLSYGKDSMACFGAIEKLGWPLDRVITAEVWATDTIPADLPPMMEFKAKADKIIKEHWGVEVEHYHAVDKQGRKQTYEGIFYRPLKRERERAENNLRLSDSQGELVQLIPQAGCSAKVTGWATKWSLYCTGELKRSAIRKAFSLSPKPQGADKNTVVQYIGIAVDEPSRFHNLNENKKSPLVEAGWTEADCRKWCEDNDLLSPIYTTATRGGCWFCHNQGVDQLRQLRRNYPEYWALMLKWDNDSPVTFKADGHTVHDFDRRFQLEDDGFIAPDDKTFRWAMLDGELNYRLF